MTFHTITRILAAGALLGALGAGTAQDLRRVRGAIKIDGSSTTYPITEAVGEEFMKAAPRVQVTVGVSGTGGGFKRFAAGETDVSNASRPIKATEKKACQENGVSFIEIPVAYDGLTIAVNRENTWVDQLTVDDLRKIFLDADPARYWNEVRDGWPTEPITVFSPGTDSGTFDYFKEVVAGKTGQMRPDMSVSEDDNVLVRGLTGEKGAIGFFGAAYYFENSGKLRSIAIINDKGAAVRPTKETIEDGSYNPFSRPLFVYVNEKSAKRREVKAFVEFYLENAPRLSEEVGYVRLPGSVYTAAGSNFAKSRTGSQYLTPEGEKVEGPVTEVYKALN